jgi:hypothetical protein
MSEKKVLIDGKVVGYNGLFRADELYGIIRRFLSERGYFMFETNNQEDVLENGRQIVIKMEPTKQLSDYAKSQIVLLITIKGLQDKVIKIDGHQQKYQHGNVSIKASAFLLTDLRPRWEGSGGRFMFRIIIDRFIKKDQMTIAQEKTRKDCEDLLDEVRSYLNMSRFKLEHKA